MDGSNATIIGSTLGEFKADRNNIARVWMDHGAWPLLTVKQSLDHSGDLAFLLREQTYFKDHHTHRCQGLDADWRPEHGTAQRTSADDQYTGSILEHLLIQHLTAFFNVGQHNMILLEDADWNDGLDMGRPDGESVAFTALYAGNLRVLAELCVALDEDGVKEIEVAEELTGFLQFLDRELDLASIDDKRQRLDAYFSKVQHKVSGRKVRLSLTDLAEDLIEKADWLTNQIRETQWCESATGVGWFNGYYDADGVQVEGEFDGVIRMTLSGQVFNVMCAIASPEQLESIIYSVDEVLTDEEVGGPRLNTDFKEEALKLGRALGYAYGHKENGAMFSHMAVMYANALYKSGKVREGWKVLERIYQHTQDFDRCRIYPGVPEYINPRGRGMYPYLTGSAAWYLMTMLNEVFGVRGTYGDLLLAPRLQVSHFSNEDVAKVHTNFAGKSLKIIYHNADQLDVGQYQIGEVMVNKQALHLLEAEQGVVIPRDVITSWPSPTQVEVSLVPLRS
jgi:cellobiose phosphorylase